MPVDLPIGPDYVLGTGDGLTINLWGGISQSFARVIDREVRSRRLKQGLWSWPG